MRLSMLALLSILLAVLFPSPLSSPRRALADPVLSGAESAQVVNGDFSGIGMGELGTPPTNHDFETPGATVGTPPTNSNFSTGDFTSWTLTGSPTIQSGGPGGYYAQLASGQKVISSAFTLDARAQVLTFSGAAVTNGAFQWELTIWYGPNYASPDVRYSTLCTNGCTNWTTYAFDVVARAGQPVKVEIARHLGDLKVDDTAVGSEVLVSWSPAAGDKVNRVTGGPTGAYARTTTTITSAAFTPDANAQNGTADFKIEGTVGSYDVYVLYGSGYSMETHVFNGLYADSSTWSTKTFALADWAGESIKLRIVPAASTTLFVDRVGLARNDISGWTPAGATPVVVATQGGVTYLKSYDTINSQDMTLDYSGYYGNTRVNWFRIVFQLSSNINCQGVQIGSTLNVYFNNSISPFWGAAGSEGGWLDAYFYVYNPYSPLTPVPQTGKLKIVGWPSSAPPYACDNARAWSPPLVASVERVDAPSPIDYCSAVGAQADELSPKSAGTSASGVDVVSGNYSHGNTDLSIPGLGVPLRFTRCYSAQSKTGGLGVTGPLGNKWSHNWIASLKEFDGGNHAHIRLPGGGSLVWTRAGDNFLPPAGYEGTLVKNQDSTWTMATWHKLIYTFDSAGKLTSVKDRNLNTVGVSYDGNGRLSTISAPGNRTLTLGYNAESRISTLSDSAGRSVFYSYNTATGDLTSVTNVLTGPTIYQYTGHLLTQATDPNGHLPVRNSYDSRIRVSQQLDALGAATTFSYSTPGAGATRVTDPKNFHTTHYFDTSMRITDVTDHHGGVTTITYDSDNNKTSVTNPLAHTTSYTYDPNGNVLSETYPLRQPLGTPESGVDGCGTLETGDGDDDDADQRIDDGCPSMKYTYTANGDIDLETDPLGRQTDYIYDDQGVPANKGNLTRVLRRDTGSNVKALTCYQLDSSGQVTAMVESTDLIVPSGPTDACTGNKTVYGYDTAGNQTCVVNARFSSDTTCVSDPGKKSTATYDAAGRVIYSTNELTNNARPVGGAAPETGTAQCGVGGTGNGVNDDPLDDGVADDGCPSVATTYDAQGNLLTSKDGLGNTTSNSYDSMGHLLKTTNANRQPDGVAETGTSCGAGTGDGDDDDGDFKNDDGCPSVIYRYDSADRLIEVLDAIGGRTTYGYDAAGNSTSITSARAPIRPVGTNGPETPAQCGPTGFGDGTNDDVAPDDSIADDGCPSAISAFDALHRLQSVTDPLGRITSYTYDAASNLQQRTDARGLVTKYFYDGADRPDYNEHWNGTTLVDTIDFTLDVAGRRTQLSDPTGATTFSYDALDRITSVTFPGSKTVGYEYDKPTGGTGAPYPGQRTKITYPDNKTVSYAYEKDGGMKTVTDNTTQVAKQTTYTYDDAGRLCRTQLPNSVYTDYAYDAADRLTGVVNRRMTPPSDCLPGETTIVSSFTYTLDAVGNRKQMVDLSGTHTYQYDPLQQLTQVDYPNPPQTDTYTYDANGNRLTKNATSYTTNAAGLMTAAGPTGYGYDNNGNQTTRGSDVFTYDHENRLTKISLPNTPVPEEPCYDVNGNGFVDSGDTGEISGQFGGTDAFYDLNSSGFVDTGDTGLVTNQFGKACSSRFTYNGDGLRTARAGSYLNWKYVWDVAAGTPMILKENDSHNAIDGHGTDNTYVYGLDLISVTDRVGGQTYFLYDGLGSTTDLTNGSGNSTATYSYDVFGAIRSQSGFSKNEFKFAGEQLDPQGNRNFLYLRARYYDPATGRFLTPDPAGEGNGYSYAFNNPVNLVDPSGLSAIDDWYDQTLFGEIGNLATTPTDSGDLLTALRLGLSVTPIISDVNDAIAYATGYDVIWGEKLSDEERVASGAALLLPFVGGGIVSKVGDVASSRALRRNLESAGFARPPGAHTHHIIAGNDWRAADARGVLQNYGIGINDADNGVFLPTGHPSVHTNAYYKSLNTLLTDATSRGQVLARLQFVRDQLRTGRWP